MGTGGAEMGACGTVMPTADSSSHLRVLRRVIPEPLSKTLPAGRGEAPPEQQVQISEVMPRVKKWLQTFG
jgi:hypothetical protein